MLIFSYQTGFVVKNLLIFKVLTPLQCNSVFLTAYTADVLHQQAATSLGLLVIIAEMTEYKPKAPLLK